MGRRRRSVLMGIANIPLLNADIVTGISLMLLFLGLGLRLGYGTILMAHIVFNLPYVILCLMPQMLSLDRNCYDAARDLGATPFMAFRRVVLPELRPSLLAGFMLAFTMSADDFIITHFTKVAGIDTLPTEIYAELKLGIHPGNLPCLHWSLFLSWSLRFSCSGTGNAHADGAVGTMRALTRPARLLLYLPGPGVPFDIFRLRISR